MNIETKWLLDCACTFLRDSTMYAVSCTFKSCVHEIYKNANKAFMQPTFCKVSSAVIVQLIELF